MSSSKFQRSTSLPLIAVLAALVAATASTAEQRASLVVVGKNPVVVEGRGFIGQERVTLRTNIAGQSFKRTVKADRDGRFTAQIAEVDAECLPFVVSAAGQGGSRGVTRRSIPPPCGMQVQP